MATRHVRYSPIGEYQPLHITATGTLVPVGKTVNTTASAVLSGSGVTVTPASMSNITVGMSLNFANGTGTAENVTVLSTTATTFTANFVNGHSGSYNITSLSGTFLGSIVVGAAGTGVAITLYNGSPNTLPSAGTAFAVITPTAGTYTFNCTLDKGLFYTLTCTAGDYTLMYLDHSV